jgi:hypothetical protein
MKKVLLGDRRSVESVCQREDKRALLRGHGEEGNAGSYGLRREEE